MKEQWRFILKRLVVGAFVFFLSLLPWKDWMLSIEFVDKNVDLAWVLLSMALPHLVRMLALGIITSALFFAIKLLTLPQKIVEKEMFRIRKKRWSKNIFYLALFTLPMFSP